jgi:hypothetical protein
MMLMRSAFFWDITQRWMVILYWHFGTTYWSHLQGSRRQKFFFLTLEDGTHTLSRNVGKGLPYDAAQYHRTHISDILRLESASGNSSKPAFQSRLHLYLSHLEPPEAPATLRKILLNYTTAFCHKMFLFDSQNKQFFLLLNYDITC